MTKSQALFVILAGLLGAVALSVDAQSQCFPTSFDCLFPGPQGNTTAATCDCAGVSITTVTATQTVVVDATATTAFCTLVIPVTSTSTETTTLSTTSTAIVGQNGQPVCSLMLIIYVFLWFWSHA